MTVHGSVGWLQFKRYKTDLSWTLLPREWSSMKKLTTRVLFRQQFFSCRTLVYLHVRTKICCPIWTVPCFSPSSNRRTRARELSSRQTEDTREYHLERQVNYFCPGLFSLLVILWPEYSTISSSRYVERYTFKRWASVSWTRCSAFTLWCCKAIAPFFVALQGLCKWDDGLYYVKRT